MDQSLHRNARAVSVALAAAGITDRIVVLPDSAATAAAAAATLGVEIGAIANSLVFDADNEPLLILASGAHRVNTEAVAARLGLHRLTRASADTVRSATGQPIGGVAPVGHPNQLRTLVDVDLAAHVQVWAAAGTPHAVFPTTFAELVTLTGGEPSVVT